MSLVDLPSGERIWFERTGRGAPLLQIHGSAFGHRNFAEMTPLMAPHCEVIDFDLPGYGESRFGPTRPGSMEDLAELVFGLIRALGHERLSIHGTSFGAMIALALAARHPEAVDRLVLSCCLARYDNAARLMRATWKRAARDSGLAAVADLTAVAGFARGFYDRPDAEAQLAAMRVAFEKNTAEAFIAGTETIERTDLSAYAPMVRAPTLCLAGDEDNMTPFRPADSGVGFVQFVPRIPGAELAVLERCGHYLVIEQPEAAAERILAFLAR